MPPDFPLHLSIDDAGADCERGDQWFFDGKRLGKMVQRGFGGAVGAPGTIGRDCRTGRGEQDGALAFAQVGNGRGYLCGG